jgi:hypothetical protein
VFKKQIKYKDFVGQERVDDLYFHMFAPDITELGFDPTIKKGFVGCVDEIARSGGNGKIIALYKLLIVSSYGRRSETGDRILKMPEFTLEFLSSQPYEEFFNWLLDDPKNAELFWNSLVLGWVAKRFGGTNRQLVDLSTEELERRTRNKLLTSDLASSK